MDPMQTQRVFSDRYELTHLIARGGMAEVYRARDRLLDRPVALKVLFPELSVDRTFVERFRREAQAAAKLSHPNIVPVFDWGEDDGTYFIVMEFVDGQPLSGLLRSNGTVEPTRAAHIAAPVAAALAYAHRHGVIHRDVKPGNVLITDDGQVKVTDFGIARAVNTEESLTQTGAVMGTATYFSPEQAEGHGVDARSDIYSLGVVLFEMLTGRPPFLGETPVSVASKHVRDLPPLPRELNPAIPAPLENIVMTAMAKSPEQRYATAEDLRSDLLRFTEGRAVAAAPAEATGVMAAVAGTQTMTQPGGTQAVPATGHGAPPPSDEEAQRRRTKRLAVILVILVVVLGVIIYFLGQSLGYWGSGGPVRVPDVTGQTAAAARVTLQKEGLKLGVTNTITSNDPVGTVVRTQPPAGATASRGQTVALFISGGPAKVSVPDVTNQPVSAAQSILSAHHLRSTVTKVQSSTPVDTVISQNPSAGTSVAKNATVALTVSAGQATVPVPDVASLTQAQAGSKLTAAGLQVGSTQSEPSDAVGPGLVIGTSPAAGTVVQKGTSVTVIVSTGPNSTTTTTAPPPTTTTTAPPPTTTTTAPPPTTTTTPASSTQSSASGPLGAAPAPR